MTAFKPEEWEALFSVHPYAFPSIVRIGEAAYDLWRAEMGVKKTNGAWAADLESKRRALREALEYRYTRDGCPHDDLILAPKSLVLE